MSDECLIPNRHQEWDATERCLVGRDPRRMTAEDFAACGIERQPLLAVIRAKCLDCVNYQPSEVRRCGDIQCPNWPYRMNADPLRAKRTLSEAQVMALRRGSFGKTPDMIERESEDGPV